MHFLVCGESGTGKTRWAIARANEAAKKGKKVIILDPFFDEWPTSAFITNDREKFLQEFWKYDECLVIVDESAITAPRGEESMIETAILGRHQGHLIIYVCQRVQQIHPTIRGQCSHLVVFGCSARDARLLADEFDNPELETAAKLPPGEFYYLHRRGAISKEKIF